METGTAVWAAVTVEREVIAEFIAAHPATINAIANRTATKARAIPEVVSGACFCIAYSLKCNFAK